MRLDLIFLLSLLLFIYSCEKQTEEFDDEKFGYDYYPLAVGNSWTYQLDSTVYDDLGATVFSTSSQVRETIVEEYVDEIGDTIHRIERSWRQDEDDSWEITDIWVTHKNLDRVTRTEENLKFIKFVFPALEDKRWDGNIFFDDFVEITVSGEPINMFADWDDYELVTVDEPESINDITYDKIDTVLQTDSDTTANTLARRYAIEKYARGVGLIYKENIILDSQNADATIPWVNRAESGFILKQSLIEHN